MIDGSSDPCCAPSLAHKADLAVQHRGLVRHDKAAALGGIRTGSPVAIFYCSRGRRGERPQRHLAGYAGILQADAYDGYNVSGAATAVCARHRPSVLLGDARRLVQAAAVVGAG